MTMPFGAVLEAALKADTQSGRLSMMKDVIRNPSFFCCISGFFHPVTGLPLVDKDPVASMAVSTRRECMNAGVTVDISLSWSSTSTINSWAIDWGDGNTSNGAWPPGAPIAHPAGGYSLPGTYTIELTVTDLIGATGSAETQIEIVDCTTFATIEAYCSLCQVSAPAVWYTNDAGGNWADRSGQVLQNTRAYDLKINPFTIPLAATDTNDNTENVELMVATERGLYRATDGARTGASWKRIVLPEPALGLGEPLPRTICYSNIDPLEVYLLVRNSANNRVWVYRTTDGCETWTTIELTKPLGTYQIANDGWTHMMHGTANSQYIFVMLYNDSLRVEILRVEYDLSTFTVAYSNANASWAGGIRCDLNYPEITWIFGELNRINSSTIFVTEDFGANWIDVSIPSWIEQHSHGPLVRPVLPSAIDPNFIFAANNDPSQLETATSMDFGETWFVSSVANPFPNNCGENGWWDDLLVFLGRQTVGANHLQLSVNLGMTMWTERSGGLTANAPISATQILFEHYIFPPA